MMAIRAGKNIAIKVPSFRYDDTVAFYRDALGLEVVRQMQASTGFAFGSMTLWVDNVGHQSQVDVWLETFSDNVEADVQRLQDLDTPKRDELEVLDTVTGHWLSDPAGTVILVREARAGE
jgi:catechol 2,3-dioxygenase-like lactoylglutathione lyase family enzyme